MPAAILGEAHTVCTMREPDAARLLSRHRDISHHRYDSSVTMRVFESRYAASLPQFYQNISQFAPVIVLF
jgi:hypothetical protein